MANLPSVAQDAPWCWVAAMDDTGTTLSGFPIGYYNGSTFTQVSVANPLPITGSISATNPSVSSTGSAVPASATYIGANNAGNLVGLLTDASGFLKVNVAAGGGAGGTSSSFGAAFPATGTAIGATDGTNMRAFQMESSSNLNVRVGIFNAANELAIDASGRVSVLSIANALPAGSNNIGGVEIFDSGGTNKLGIDSSGRVTVLASGNFNNAAIGATGSAIPTSANFLGASDGTNLQGLLVESTSNKNLRIGVYNGANEMAVDASGRISVLGITNALPAGSNIIGALTANQSVNAAQVAGTATSVNSGTADAGTQRSIQAGAATGTKTNVASSATSVTILASNTSRKGAVIYNDSTQILYLDLSGGTASSASYSVQMPSQSYFELPGPTIYNGAITGIWASANGNARVTEFS